LVRAKEELGHFRVFKKNDIPDEWHYKNHARVAPIITVAEFKWFILQVILKTPLKYIQINTWAFPY
jgi:hypothetical protein